MVTFDLLPPTTRGPLAYTEIAAATSQNVPTQKPLRALLVGQRRSGTVPALTLTRVTSAVQAQTYFGAGSQLHEMAVGWFANNKGTEVWAIPVADAGGSVAEIRTMTVGGSPTSAGLIALYLAGHRFAVSVAAGEATAATAANLNAAINADPAVPFLSTVLGSVVTLTAKNAGTLGAELDARHSYGANESLPPGTTLVFAVTTPGTGVVSYSTLALFGLMPQTQFDIITVGANDATNLGYVTAELLDRWGPTRELEGGVFTGFAGDLSASLAQGLLLNSQFSSQMPVRGTLTPSWVIGAALAGAAAFYLGQDPARPLHTVPLLGVLASKVSDQWTQNEREQLLHGGMATHKVAADGTVQVHRCITNYRLSPGGAADDTYLDVNTWATLSLLRYSWRTNLLNKYPRHKLADDGTAFAEGQPVMTPERGRAEAMAWFIAMEAIGLVEGRDQFKADLRVERNGSDRNRMDFLLPINLVNQLQVIGTRIEFTL